jgi:glyoxylase-like metal-dependent hydrolase (beta-lactamase superfamily II)
LDRSRITDAKVREVWPGVFVVHLPLPMRPTIVNVTLLRSGNEWALVDTGVNSADSVATLEAAVEQVGGALEKIKTIICTHHHPDHFGASKTYKERCGAELYMNRLEWESIDVFTPHSRSDAVVRFFIENGFPINQFVEMPSPGEFWAGLFVPASPDHFIGDGDVIRVGDFEIEVIHTPGHTRGHCVLYLRRERIMIAGDHLLPKITPHVGFYPGGPPDPLGDFLESQRKVQRFDVQMVLPAHGGVYADHRHRANQIIQHHQYRMQEMLDLVRRRARTAYDVASQAFSFDIESPLMVQFPATFETLAHLEHLRVSGRVVREERDERILYRAT